MTVRLVTDSACDLPQPTVEHLGITVVPLTIRFGAEDFLDRQDLSATEFWRRCAASAELPETAAPSPGQFEEAYQRCVDDGATGIVVLSLSGALSATMQSAQLAARDFADAEVRVIDTRSLTVGQGMIVVACARRAADGASIDEVAALGADLADRSRVFGALDTLENLRKGGRIGGAKAFLASALAIKPIVEVRNGKVEQAGKQRTRTKALAYLVEKVRSAGAIENLAILQADCDDVDAFLASLREVYDGDILVAEIGAVIGTHVGPGTMGVAYQVASPAID